MAIALTSAVALFCGPACEREPEAALVFAEASAEPPAYGEIPFPSDVYQDEKGRIVEIPDLFAIAPLNTGLVAAHVSALDGFSVRPVMEVFIQGRLDEEAVARAGRDQGGALFLMDVDPKSASRGTVIPTEWRIDASRSRVVGTPLKGAVLQDGTRYAVVVTSALRDAGGTSLKRPPAFSRLVDLEKWEVPKKWRPQKDTMDALWQMGLGDDVILAVSFTTQRATHKLVATKRMQEELAAPTLSFPEPAFVYADAARLDALFGNAQREDGGEERWGWANPTGMAHDHVAALGTGVMTAPFYLSENDGSFLPHAGTFFVEGGAAAKPVDAAAPLPITFVLPRGEMPTRGFPVVIFGHGLSASRHQIMAVAEPLTRAGYAVVAIDAAGHGSRHKDKDEHNNLAARLSAFSGVDDGPDGFGDVVGLSTTFSVLQEFRNLSAVRDTFIQSVLDVSSVARLLSDPHLDLSPLMVEGGPLPRLDPQRIVYMGESFGGVVGAMLAAIENRVSLYVLNVPGGGILDLALLGSPVMRPLVVPWVSSLYGIDTRLDRFDPIIGLGQAMLDAADPLSFAPHVFQNRFAVDGKDPLGPRHLVMIEVIGDEVLPNRSTHALARALGMPLLTPHLIDVDGLSTVEAPVQGNVQGQTAALIQSAPATHGSNWISDRGERRFFPFTESDDEDYEVLEESVWIENPMRETWAQLIPLLDSHGESGAPILGPGKAPVADFDDDGVPDEDEMEMGRNPFGIDP
jgi:pimeloyl-ACP methyl ester carboxylesterase